MAAKWTIMLYMAGDNGNLPVFASMETPGYQDLEEVKRVGSTAAVNVLAQFDTLSDRRTRRYRLTQGVGLQGDLVQTLDETNTGDPKQLTNFIVWSAQSYPADHYALVLWNHGNGWSDEDVYASFRGGVSRGGLDVPHDEVRSLRRSRFRLAPFRTTLEELPVRAAVTSRGILYDDTSLDFLTNEEMKQALADALAQANLPKIDIVGMDACLMSMIEVAYQVKDACGYLVGSQEVEPMAGWPYDTILAPLAANPAMSAKELCKLIVNKYVDHFAGIPFGDSATQSALVQDQLPALVSAVDALAGVLIEKLGSPAVLNKLADVWGDTQRFEKKEYIDLRDFCERLAKATRDPQIVTAATQVKNVASVGKGPLVANGHTGSTVKRAKGISIYFPEAGLWSEDGMAKLYQGLDFARDCRWAQFLTALYSSRESYRSGLGRTKGRGLSVS